MAFRQVLVHPWRQRDSRVIHAQRIEDSFLYQRLVGFSRSHRQRLAQQADAEIRVFELGADVARELIPAKEFEHLLDRVVGVGIHRIRGLHVVGQARQSRRLLREVDQRDGFPVALGHAHAVAQMFRDRVVEIHLAAIGHVGQEDRGEDLGDGTDFEHGIGVERRRIWARIAVGRHRRRAVRLNGGDHHAAGVLGVDAGFDRGGDLGVAGPVGGGNTERQEECGRDGSHAAHRITRSSVAAIAAIALTLLHFVLGISALILRQRPPDIV